MIDPGIQLVLRERRVDPAQELLHQEPADARAGIDRGQDEERLEHDGEVVPVGHQPRHPGERGEDLRHPDGERHRAAGPPGDRLADRLFEHREVHRGHAQGSRRPPWSC